MGKVGRVSSTSSAEGREQERISSERLLTELGKDEEVWEPEEEMAWLPEEGCFKRPLQVNLCWRVAQFRTLGAVDADRKSFSQKVLFL